MGRLRYTLVADGPSDRALLRIIDWLLYPIPGVDRIVSQFADFRHLREPPSSLDERISFALRTLPCDVLFVHRDAEGAQPSQRMAEIERAISAGREVFHVPVVPVRMTEAWLLIDEAAIRTAAGNPQGKVQLSLPAMGRLEDEPDPKKLLKDLLRKASQKTGRRMVQFQQDLNRRVHRVADLIGDFEPLRTLPAFRQFEQDTRRVVRGLLG